MIEQVQLLIGKVAPMDFLNRITYLSMTHDDHILHIDTVRAYHAGEAFIVEVDVVMDPSLPLKTAHDVAESLQVSLTFTKSVIHP